MMYLIIGNCGVGKTHVMKSLMSFFNITPVYSYGTGLYRYLKKDGIVLLGKYDGSTFEGSDKLSMSIMADNAKIQPIFKEAKVVVGEGDRFTNSTFISTFKPTIVLIEGDGEEGRKKRGSQQTERHLKSIATRVSNIKPDLTFPNSIECFEFLAKKIMNR